MAFLFSLLIVALAITSTFVQARDHILKRYISPALPACCGLLVCYGALTANVPRTEGLVVALALLLLATSDAVFEQSEDKPGLFPVAMLFGVVSGFLFGFLFNVVAVQAGVPLLVHVGCGLLGLLAAFMVYRYLDVEPALRVAVYVYLAQAVLLFAGGLASIFAGCYPFAVWGILLFFSDALVGLRAFPDAERPLAWLPPSRILPAILVIYYTALYGLVVWAT